MPYFIFTSIIYFLLKAFILYKKYKLTAFQFPATTYGETPTNASLAVPEITTVLPIPVVLLLTIKQLSPFNPTPPFGFIVFRNALILELLHLPIRRFPLHICLLLV
jgi:hypothetical protein